MIGALLFSCSNEPVTITNDLTNKFTINNKDYIISKAVSYIEANNVDPDFYYFDISFLTQDIEISASNDTGYSGLGNLFLSSFINETKTFLSDGDYTYTDTANDFFDVFTSVAVTDYDFDNDSGAEEDIYEFKSAVFKVTRDGNIYTITGSGSTSSSTPFTLYYKGALERDPDSD